MKRNKKVSYGYKQGYLYGYHDGFYDRGYRSSQNPDTQFLIGYDAGFEDGVYQEKPEVTEDTPTYQEAINNA